MFRNVCCVLPLKTVVDRSGDPYGALLITDMVAKKEIPFDLLDVPSVFVASSSNISVSILSGLLTGFSSITAAFGYVGMLTSGVEGERPDGGTVYKKGVKCIHFFMRDGHRPEVLPPPKKKKKSPALSEVSIKVSHRNANCSLIL